MKLIGIDSGGTSCRLLLCTESGRVLSACRVKGCNPNMAGIEAYLQVLRAGLETLLAEHGGLTAPLGALCCSAAGITTGTHMAQARAFLQGLLPGCGQLFLCSDTLAPLQAALGSGDGGVLIAGTGVVGLVRREGVTTQLGGWGYLLDPGGSGFHIGRDGWTAALADYTGTGPRTVLTARYTQLLGEDPHTALRQVYQDSTRASQCAPLVLTAAQEGDAVACSVLRYNAGCLAHLADIMALRLPAPARLAPCGGLLETQPFYFDLVKSQMKQPVIWVAARVPAVCGAAMLAAEAAGHTVTDAFPDEYLATC